MAEVGKQIAVLNDIRMASKKVSHEVTTLINVVLTWIKDTAAYSSIYITERYLAEINQKMDTIF